MAVEATGLAQGAVSTFFVRRMPSDSVGCIIGMIGLPDPNDLSYPYMVCA